MKEEKRSQVLLCTGKFFPECSASQEIPGLLGEARKGNLQNMPTSQILKFRANRAGDLRSIRGICIPAMRKISVRSWKISQGRSRAKTTALLFPFRILYSEGYPIPCRSGPGPTVRDPAVLVGRLMREHNATRIHHRAGDTAEIFGLFRRSESSRRQPQPDFRTRWQRFPFFPMYRDRRWRYHDRER
jgi:hypothetical protein